MYRVHSAAVSSSERAAILNKHNTLRGGVSPSASNMLKMVGTTIGSRHQYHDPGWHVAAACHQVHCMCWWLARVSGQRYCDVIYPHYSLFQYWKLMTWYTLVISVVIHPRYLISFVLSKWYDVLYPRYSNSGMRWPHRSFLLHISVFDYDDIIFPEYFSTGMWWRHISSHLVLVCDNGVNPIPIIFSLECADVIYLSYFSTGMTTWLAMQRDSSAPVQTTMMTVTQGSRKSVSRVYS